MPGALSPWRAMMRRFGSRTAAALAAVLGTVAFMAAVPGRQEATMATRSLPPARQCASVARSSPSQIVVPVVVDTGGASDGAQVSCVPVAAGSNDAQVLAARAALLGVPAPRYGPSGLLCAIDGYPATGCGVESGGHFAYWAYYHGGTSWTYASVGPASWQVFTGDVEGWRFQAQGNANPSDPPPRSASDAATLCPSSVPSTTTTTTASNPPSTVPPPTVPPGSSPSGGHTPNSSSSAPSGAPKTAPAGSGTHFVPTTAGTAVSPATAAPSSTGTAAPAALGSTGTRPSPGLAGARRSAGQLGAPLGLIVAIAVIVLLGLGAVIRTRRLTKAR